MLYINTVYVTAMPLSLVPSIPSPTPLTLAPVLIPPPELVPLVASPSVCIRPLFGQRISAGFPSPADGYIEKGLDLNTYLVRNQVATFFFRIHGDSMIGARIHDGDLVVVDRSVTPKHRSIVLAVVNQEYTVKRLYRRAGVVELRPENPAYQPICFGDGETLEVWGVVVGTVCRFDS